MEASNVGRLDRRVFSRARRQLIDEGLTPRLASVLAALGFQKLKDVRAAEWEGLSGVKARILAQPRANDVAENHFVNFVHRNAGPSDRPFDGNRPENRRGHFR